MKTPSFRTIADQVAEHLTTEILRGQWSSVLPGKHQLADHLGVNNKTVEVALRQLEKAGILLSQGVGRNRLINPRHRNPLRELRIALLLNELPDDAKSELHLEITHALTDVGHTVIVAPKSLDDLRFDPKRVAKLVHETEADAWIIYGGSRDVLEWFASEPVRAFALSGHRIGIKIPAVSPHKPPAVAAATQHLIALGHRRIILLCRKIRRLPKPGLSETVFLETLRSSGCTVSDYNLPDWQETNVGFQECLRSLFRTTPPTAMIVDEVPYFVATMQFLLARGIRVPADLSIVSTDDNIAFSHCEPPVACITWDINPVVHRIVKWATNVGRGKTDCVQTLTAAEFVTGGTIGPVPDHLAR